MSIDTLLAIHVDPNLEASPNFDQQHSTVTSMTHFNGLILIWKTKLKTARQAYYSQCNEQFLKIYILSLLFDIISKFNNTEPLLGITCPGA